MLSGIEMKSGPAERAGAAAAGGASAGEFSGGVSVAAFASGGLRVTTATNRSCLPRISRAISNSSNVRHEIRMAFTNAEKPASSG